MKKQLHAICSGQVQGVGFSYTAERLARKFSVTGFVRNLSNGQVELVAEGEEKLAQEFLSDVREAFSPYIQDVQVRWGPSKGEFKSFRIEF
jgi:acylphosphatase